MAQMAICARFGGVQPDVFLEMDYLEAAELTRRLLKMKTEEDEQLFKFAAEMTKAIVKSNGARVM